MANKIFIICVLLLGSTQVIIAAVVDVTLKSSMVADVCLDVEKREVIVSVSIGSVAAKDNLFGYEIQLKFKKDKIKFYETLKINTLSEPCKYLIDEFTDSTANIQGLMGSVGTPMFGNKSLVAIIGQYTGECPDSTDIEIDYFDAVEGYSNTIGKLNGTKVYSRIINKDERFLKTEIDSNTILSKDNYVSIPFKYMINPTIDSRLNSIKYRINYDFEEILELVDVIPVNSNSTKIENISGNKGVYYFDVKITGTETTNDFILKFKTKTNIDFNSKVKITPVILNDCACVTNLSNDSVIVIGIKDTIPDTSTVVEYYNKNEINKKIVTNENEITINCENIFTDIKLYDINGNLLNTNTINNGSFIIIGIAWLNPGVYICVYRNLNKELKRIMLIKY